MLPAQASWTGAAFFTAFLALSSTAPMVHAETITLRADVWCPFNCEPQDPRPGYMIEIAKAALEKADSKIEYANLNWARAIVESRNGAFTGIVGAAKSDAPDFVYPANSLGVSKNCFYVKPDNKWEYKGVESLPAITFGVIKDYSYDDALDAYIKANGKDPKKIDVVSGDNPLELNLKKLQAGRITAFVEEQSVVKSYMFKKKLENVVKAAGCTPASDLYVAFSPKDPKAKEHAKIVSDKVAAMRKDGSLAKLLEQYGLTDWK